MFKISCDICKRDLVQPAVTAGNFHFCERCGPFHEAYIQEVVKITVESTQAFMKAVDRFRNRYYQEKVRSASQPISG